MFIMIIKGANVGNVAPVNKDGNTTIGRGKDCDVKILDLMVSRKHCVIEGKNNKYFIKDLNSRNKTHINKDLIQEPTRLKINDLITIGTTEILFTDQKDISIQSVEDYNNIRMSQTRSIDAKNPYKLSG